MHSKEKGNLGELRIAADLVSQGYPVFTELGDNSKVDLIALVGNKPIKLQVKALKEVNGVVSLDTRKSGPSYSFRYSIEQIDIFAVYVYNRDVIFYISAEELLVSKASRKFRLDKPKNDCGTSSMVYDYSEFTNCLGA